MKTLIRRTLKGLFALALALVATPAYAGLIDDYTANANNRCGDNVIPPGECPAYQEAAFYGVMDGAGHTIVAPCINVTEYDFAKQHNLAPQCSTVIPGKYVGWCRCGCFERGTRILTFDNARGSDDWRTVEAIDARKDMQDAVTLAEAATLDDLELATHGIEATTVGKEENPLVVVFTSDGVRLGLTERHAVLLADGSMVAAADLTAGDELVTKTGEPVQIDRIDRITADAKVFNLLTQAPIEDKGGHLIIANGLIVGDLAWQNTLANELGEIAVRR